MRWEQWWGAGRQCESLAARRPCGCQNWSPPVSTRCWWWLEVQQARASQPCSPSAPARVSLKKHNPNYARNSRFIFIMQWKSLGQRLSSTFLFHTEGSKTKYRLGVSNDSITTMSQIKASKVECWGWIQDSHLEEENLQQLLLYPLTSVSSPRSEHTYIRLSVGGLSDHWTPLHPILQHSYNVKRNIVSCLKHQQ